jgi:hypothetical protein
MANTVFFAWQLDTPSEFNKKFIWEALQSAALHMGTGSLPEMSPRPEKDTEGVPGTPNIVHTIFKRIAECSAFVADITFIAKSEAGKKTPNPNVLLELGYAVRSIGWDRTILVLNDTYGAASELPFDMLQHRWPIQYRVNERTQVGEKKFNSLTEAFQTALVDCSNFQLNRAVEMAQALDTICLDIVAEHEFSTFVPMTLPPQTMGQALNSLVHDSAIRRLVDLGALQVVVQPEVSYGWTSDGRRMIEEIKRMHPGILAVLRDLKAKGPPNKAMQPTGKAGG